MFKSLYAHWRTVYATRQVNEGDISMREGFRNSVTLVFATAVIAAAVTVSLGCNTIEPRQLLPTTEDNATCVNQCVDQVRDPEPVDCAAAEEGVEFYPIPVWDFEGTAASNLYSYNDGSIDFFRSIVGRDPMTGELLRDESQGVRKIGFEPDVRKGVRRCLTDDPENGASVLHIQGGPFRAWGGAVGRHLKCLNSAGGNIMPSSAFTTTHNEDGIPDPLNKGCGTTPAFACSNRTDDSLPLAVPSDPEAALAFTACPQRDIAPVGQSAPEERFMLGMTLDLSQWDGISFWARRSNDSQPGVRIALGDKYTDDDLSYLQYHLNPDDERFCERNQECGCAGGRECVNGTCYDPRVDPEPLDGEVTTKESFVDGSMYPLLNEDNAEGYGPCGQNMCERGFLAFRGTDGTNPREDVAFAGTTCQAFTFRGGIQDDFCVDTATGRTPYENTHVCGDHWLKPVHLSTEWQLFKVPFTDLLQQGWAQESYHLDLTSAAVIRFIWGRGWIDMMLDDVRFYRNKYTKD